MSAVPPPKLSGRFSTVTERGLVRAGWREGRHCDISQVQAALASHGFVLHERAKAFLTEFHGLAIDVPINGYPAIQGFVHLDVLWALRFVERKVQSLVSKPVCPIGTCSGHSTYVLMAVDGATYLLDSDWTVFAPLAPSGSEALELLCDGRNGRVDSMLLVDERPSGHMLRENNERDYWGLSCSVSTLIDWPQS